MKPLRCVASVHRPKFGLARALSKLGYCSRSEAWALIESSRVRLNGAICRNPEFGVDLERDRIHVDNQPIQSAIRLYVVLNKPRGLVTTRSDEQGRDTVYSCFSHSGLPWLAPVGRLDKASEGLLLFTNDTEWADRVTAPEHGLDKVYHVQVGTLVNAALLEKFEHGTRTAQGDFLRAKRIRLLRQGSRNCWLEVVLDEGKNRHIRRLLEAFHCPVLRLIRVAIGSLELGSLAKGLFRHLTETEIRALTSKSVWP